MLIIRAWEDGYRVRKPRKRTTQREASFLIDPGGEARYEHRDAHTADHAPMDEIFAAPGG